MKKTSFKPIIPSKKFINKNTVNKTTQDKKTEKKENIVLQHLPHCCGRLPDL